MFSTQAEGKAAVSLHVVGRAVCHVCPGTRSRESVHGEKATREDTLANGEVQTHAHTHTCFSLTVAVHMHLHRGMRSTDREISLLLKEGKMYCIYVSHR